MMTVSRRVGARRAVICGREGGNLFASAWSAGVEPLVEGEAGETEGQADGKDGRVAGEAPPGALAMLGRLEAAFDHLVGVGEDVEEQEHQDAHGESVQASAQSRGGRAEPADG